MTQLATKPDKSVTGKRRSPPLQLIVFSDDWGRHPSSCQHLVRHLLDDCRVLWVNTIGTRVARLTRPDMHKAAMKLQQWLRPRRRNEARGAEASKLTVINPIMYPGFRRPAQRRLNARLLSSAVKAALKSRGEAERLVAVTTIPIVADLVGQIPVDRWVYYCVDNFSVWPGLDGTVMDQMERRLVSKVDSAIAVSAPLVERLAAFGCTAELLTHGIDRSHWSTNSPSPLPVWWSTLKRPIFLFWGVVDQRLDEQWCRVLVEQCGTLVLVGPQQSPPTRLTSLERVCMPGPVPYGGLPSLAAAADVLVMPYADLPVTRAIQPLKLKEYLATGRPAIVRKLPSTMPWSDAAVVLEKTDDLIRIARLRAAEGTPPEQLAARERLVHESWEAKARQFRAITIV